MSWWSRFKAKVGPWWAAVETKVKAAVTGSFVLSLVVALLNMVSGHSELLGALPPVVQLLTLAVVPPSAAAVAGYAAKHTNR